MVSYPFGPADVQTPAHATTQNITVTNQLTIFRPATASGNVTLNVEVDGSVHAGAMLLVVFKTTATETLTFGTGIDGITITGVAGKTKTKLFVYDGSVFIATNEQID